jgi:hypothetical protein
LDTIGNSDCDIPSSSQIAACEAAPFWRPIQVAAWILKRDIWLVARLEALVTQPTSYSVGEVWLEAFLDLVEQTNDVKDDIVNRAAAEIVARAGSGTLESSAMRNGSGQRHLLAAHEWAGATIHFADYRESIVPTGQKWGPGDRHWTALRFERQQVVSLWPPEPQEGPQSLQEGPPSLQSPPRPITKKEGDRLAAAMCARGIGKEDAVRALMDEHGNPRHWWRERYGQTQMGRLRRVSPVRS